jgi:hypothetical protein
MHATQAPPPPPPPHLPPGPPLVCRSPLITAAPYIHSVDASTFRFAFCGNITDTRCPPDSTYAVSMLYTPNPGCLQNLGTLPSVAASALNGDPTQGIVLTTSGTQPCGGSGPLPQTTFTMRCDPTVTTLRVDNGAYGQATCSLQLFLSSAAACPYEKRRVVQPLGAGWLVFITLAVSAVVYLGGGMAYKRWRYGATGAEAVPNIEFWRWLGRRCTGCCRGGSGGGGGGGEGAADGYYKSYDEL